MEQIRNDCIWAIAKHLIQIDRKISRRLLRRIPSYETTLTDELLASLDGETCSREDPRLAGALKAELAEIKQAARIAGEAHGVASWNLRVHAFDHSRGFEAQVSNVDVGLLIEFGERGDAEYRRYVYLLQAKRLQATIHDDGPATFHARSDFKSFQIKQHHAMLKFEEKFKLDIFRYMYYMPSREHIEPGYHESADSGSWLDLFGRCGIWIGRVTGSKLLSPAEIYRAYRQQTAPLISLIIGHTAESFGDTVFANGIWGRASTGMRDVRDTPADEDLALALVSGDLARLRRVQVRMGIDPSGYAPVPNTILHMRLPLAPEPRPVLRADLRPTDAPGR